jgi:hypothetical protein
LTGNGYQLVDIPTVVTTEQFIASNKTEEAKAYIEDVYFKECKRIIEEVTGGVGLIIPTSFRLREQKGAKESTNEKLGSVEARYAPRPVAHLDRDTPTAIPVLEEAVGKEKAQELLSKYDRWAQVNVWRPIGKQYPFSKGTKAHQVILGNPATMWPLCFINHDRIPEWNYDTHVGHVWSMNDPRVADRGKKSYDCVVKHDARYDYHYASSLKPEVRPPACHNSAGPFSRLMNALRFRSVLSSALMIPFPNSLCRIVLSGIATYRPTLLIAGLSRCAPWYSFR